MLPHLPFNKTGQYQEGINSKYFNGNCICWFQETFQVSEELIFFKLREIYTHAKSFAVNMSVAQGCMRKIAVGLEN